MYRKITGMSKRKKVTLIARLMAALMVAVVLIISEFVYIFALRSARVRAYAGEIDGDTIVIPTEDPEEDEESEPVKPIVKITIKEPLEWHRKFARVKISAEDIADSGDFILAEAKAKIGNSGSWTDITDSMEIGISEDCVIYVEVTDTKGRTYSKNKKISCFDNTKPTLNAAVNNGSLTIETNDEDSGVKAVYVNGFEFNDLTEGSINIRMQQFDTGYENFSIQAMDNAGNLSETYKVKNPYYRKKDGSGKEAKILPDSASPTKPAEAVANVTDHIKTDGDGNTLKNVSSNSLEKAESKENEKKKAFAEADREETGKVETEPGKGREFYTIEAKSGKVFYLIIDRDGENEEVHFVTDITENDLLNVTDDTSGTLPQNAAYTDTDGTVNDSALPNNNILPDSLIGKVSESPGIMGTEETEESASTEALSEDEIPWEEKEESPFGKIAFIVITGVLFGAVIFAVKKIRNNPDDRYYEDEDDEDEDGEEYPQEEESEEKNVEDAFFDEADDEEAKERYEKDTDYEEEEDDTWI